MEYYIKALKNYAVFTGRANRKEFWMFSLINLIIILGLAVFEIYVIKSANSTESSLLANIYSIAILIPTIAVTVRRLHDTNKSGWWVLFNLLPIIGPIIILIFAIKEGDPGENQFGPNTRASPSTIQL